jgi:hypothetical protein
MEPLLHTRDNVVEEQDHVEPGLDEAHAPPVTQIPEYCRRVIVPRAVGQPARAPASHQYRMLLRPMSSSVIQLACAGTHESSILHVIPPMSSRRIEGQPAHF